MIFRQNQNSRRTATQLAGTKGSDWRYMDEIILSIDGEIITLTDDGPYRIRKSGDTVTESVTSLLDKDTFIGLRYCKSLVIQYYHKPITIPQEGLEAIWNFLKAARMI